MENQVVVKDLRRTFKSTKGIIKKEKKIIEAIKGISFDIKKGEVFGLLGENGAGKTTTIKILTTLLFPTSGSVEIMGYDPVKEADKIRPYINFVFGGERSLYWRLSARDNLRYFAELYRLDDSIKSKRIDEVLELVGLKGHQYEKVETYSKGMKQRLQIARGFINDPQIIFLDEPTIGLDPIGARDLRNIVKHLKELGKTILLTTHYMYEADELCDRICLMKKGELLTIDSPQNLKDKHSGLSIISIELLNLKNQCLNQIKNLPGVINVHIKSVDQKQVMNIQCKQIASIMKDVMFILKDEEINNISSRESTLEDTYIKLIGEE